MSRRRIVYAGHVAQLSGGELALSRLLPALLEHVEPLVVLGEDGPLVDVLRRDGIETRVLPMVDRARTVRRDDLAGMVRGASSSVGYARRLADLLRTEHAELLHTNSLKAHLYGGAAGRLTGVPVLWHLRDRIADDYLPRTQIRMIRSVARIVPTAVVANSESTASTIRPYVRSRTSITVIPSPVREFGPSAPTEAHDGFTFVCLGRLAPWKGQDVFLRAFADGFAGTSARAVIAGAALFGEYDYERSLPRLAAELGIHDQVEFAGHVADIGPLLARCDALVHCSVIPEPFGQVIVEGMAAGVPVIAAHAGGAAETVTAGVDGLLTPPGDIGALAKAMAQLQHDGVLRARLTGAGRETAQRYRPSKIASDLIATYDVLLGDE